MVRSLQDYVWVAIVAAALTGAALFLGTNGWPHADRTLEFAAVVLAAVLVSAFAAAPSFAEDRGMMTPHFVVDFGALLLLGRDAALFAATGGIVMRGILDPQRVRPLRRAALSSSSALAAIAAAWLAQAAVEYLIGDVAWPWQAVPILAAITGYCLVRTLVADLIAPLVSKQPINAEWSQELLAHAPHYFVGAALAAALVEIVNNRSWGLLAVAAVPLYCAYRAYGADMTRLEDSLRRREVLPLLNQGMSIVDRSGCVLFWSDELERIVGVGRERAVGRPLAAAVPALAQTPLGRAVEDVMAKGTPLSVSPLTLASPSSRTRLLEVRILPVTEGVALLWQDVSDRAQADQTLKRNEERLALAADGANDGLWELDLRTHAFYVSGRWKAMLGMAAAASTGRPEEWLERVHPDDRAGLKQALDAHFAGTTDHFAHEHRIR
ncbi:MAG TPA: PAS domain-containing protein, partial [Vicinamibacterales bacterium]|nr:PAS domain-containing protein [Vicinamibacterales bacterium]